MTRPSEIYSALRKQELVAKLIKAGLRVIAFRRPEMEEYYLPAMKAGPVVRDYGVFPYIMHSETSMDDSFDSTKEERLILGSSTSQDKEAIRRIRGRW